MKSKMIPAVYLGVRHFTQSYEARKRTIEKMQGLDADEAREKVLMLANTLIRHLQGLSENIERGELEQ